MKEAGDIKDPIPKSSAFLGVLSLDGMLPAIIAAKNETIRILYLPAVNDIPLTQMDGLGFLFVHMLLKVIQSFSGQLTISSITPTIH